MESVYCGDGLPCRCFFSRICNDPVRGQFDFQKPDGLIPDEIHGFLMSNNVVVNAGRCAVVDLFDFVSQLRNGRRGKRLA